MPYYILESSEEILTIGGVPLHGISTTGYSPLWLYVVSTEEKLMDWPESSTGRGSRRRRAPDGVGNWWVVVGAGAKARSIGGLRSNGKPLDSPPQDYPVFNWPDQTDGENTRIADDLSAILADGRISTTEKESQINARIGQGAFRSDVLRRWDQRCAVTGSLTLEAVRASHIKPWRDSNDEERLDPNNGLPLVASLDALFDVGLISFDSSGTLIVSPALSASEQQLFGLAGQSLWKVPSSATARYLEYHRNSFFRR